MIFVSMMLFKLEVFARQNKQLIEEFNLVNKRLNALEDQNKDLTQQIRRYKGDSAALDELTIQDYETLEKDMKKALPYIEAKKAELIRTQIEAQKEQRLCVICQEREKSVVLLPCRHLCLCDTCSLHDALDMCPLCREPIAHKISVFS